MKNLEIKCWSIVIGFLLLLLFMTSCRTVDTTKHKSLEEVKADLVETSKTDQKAEVKTESQINETEVKALMSLLQNLQIGYEGKELEDKLDFLIKKTAEGTQVTIAGKGKANYTETSKKEIESLKKELFQRQDSFNNLQAEMMKSLQADIYIFSKSKDKEVKVRGFQAGTYITIGVVLIVLAVLAWIAKKFKLFDKIKIFNTNGSEV